MSLPKAYVAAQSPGKVNVMGSAHLEMPLVSRQGEGAEEVKIKVIGSSSFVGSCFAHHADIEVSGSSSLKLNGIFGKADVEVSGASKVSLSGRCDRFEAEVSGSSKLDAERFISRAVDIDVSSSAKAVVHATESLNADVSSSGKLDYIGNPRHRSLEQSGGGKVGRK